MSHPIKIFRYGGAPSGEWEQRMARKEKQTRQALPSNQQFALQVEEQDINHDYDMLTLTNNVKAPHTPDSFARHFGKLVQKLSSPLPLEAMFDAKQLVAAESVRYELLTFERSSLVVGNQEAPPSIPLRDAWLLLCGINTMPVNVKGDAISATFKEAVDKFAMQSGRPEHLIAQQAAGATGRTMRHWVGQGSFSFNTDVFTRLDGVISGLSLPPSSRLSDLQERVLGEIGAAETVPLSEGYAIAAHLLVSGVLEQNAGRLRQVPLVTSLLTFAAEHVFTKAALMTPPLLIYVASPVFSLSSMLAHLKRGLLLAKLRDEEHRKSAANHDAQLQPRIAKLSELLKEVIVAADSNSPAAAQYQLMLSIPRIACDLSERLQQLCTAVHLGTPFTAEVVELVLADAFNFPLLMSNACMHRYGCTDNYTQRVKAAFLRASQLFFWWNCLADSSTATTQSLIDVQLASSQAASSLLTEATCRFHRLCCFARHCRMPQEAGLYRWTSCVGQFICSCCADRAKSKSADEIIRPQRTLFAFSGRGAAVGAVYQSIWQAMAQLFGGTQRTREELFGSLITCLLNGVSLDQLNDVELLMVALVAKADTKFVDPALPPPLPSQSHLKSKQKAHKLFIAMETSLLSLGQNLLTHDTMLLSPVDVPKTLSSGYAVAVVAFAMDNLVALCASHAWLNQNTPLSPAAGAAVSSTSANPLRFHVRDICNCVASCPLFKSKQAKFGNVNELKQWQSIALAAIQRLRGDHMKQKTMSTTGPGAAAVASPIDSTLESTVEQLHEYLRQTSDEVAIRQHLPAECCAEDNLIPLLLLQQQIHVPTCSHKPMKFDTCSTNMERLASADRVEPPCKKCQWNLHWHGILIGVWQSMGMDVTEVMEMYDPDLLHAIFQLTDANVASNFRSQVKQSANMHSTNQRYQGTGIERVINLWE